MLDPLIIHALIIENIFFGLIEPVTMLEKDAILYLVIYLLLYRVNSKPFEIDDLLRHLFLFAFHNENCLLDELQINIVFFSLIAFRGFRLDPRLSLEVLRLIVVSNLPNISMKA